MKLFAPPTYTAATGKEKERICNGCGTKGLGGWFVPDTLWGLSITDCCDIHDWMYEKGKDIADKEAADRAFLNNMVRKIDSKSGFFHSCLRRPRLVRARTYYNTVKYVGGPAFWSGKN